MPTIAMYSVWLLHSKEKAMKPKSWKQGLSRTTENYASRTSIHGISYIFDWDLSFADRLFWTIFTLSFLALAILLTWNNWTQWQENQVKTLSICPTIPHICHGRADGVRVNVFGRCKFLQI